MRRIRLSKMVPVLAVLALVAAPVTAQDIEAGDDSWATPGGGNTWVDLSSADWQAICQTSSNQIVRITFKGVAMQGQGDGSVVVERTEDAVFDSAGLAQVDVRMKHLEFESTSTTSTPCGNLDFKVVLNGTQPTAQMEIERQGSWGGRFFVDLPVNAIVEARNPSTGALVGDVLKEGILYEPATGTPWSYDPPNNPLDPDAAWHPGVTSTGQKVTIARHHTFPASHAYKPVTYCGSGSVGVASTASSSIDIAQPSPCPQPIDREERHDVEDSQDVSGSGDIGSASN